MRDPWRVVDPLPAEREGKLDEPDHETEFRARHSRVLRFAECSIEVIGHDADAPEGALARLAGCVSELESSGLLSGVATAGPPGEAASSLRAGTSVVSFPGTSIDDGALALVRAMSAASRRPAGRAALTRWGIRPMLRSR